MTVDNDGIQCFLSYCHEDIDRTTFGYLIDLLRRYCGDSVKFLFDLDDWKFGRTIEDYIDTIENVPAILMIMTPKYKERVNERQGGVYKEYNRIVARYDKESKEDNVGRRFLLIPILMSGDKTTSAPKEFQDIRYADLVGFRAYYSNQKRRLIVADSVRTKYIPEIKDIASQITALEVLSSKSYEADHRQYYRRFFVDTKERGIDESLVTHMDDILVKTSYYIKTKRQEVVLLVGRKGSGKTLTGLALSIERENPYLAHVLIDADRFSLQPIYSLTENRQLNSDIKNVFTRHRMFEYAWEAFIISCCIGELSRQMGNNRWTTNQRQQINELKTHVEEIVNAQDSYETASHQFPLLVYCFNQTQLFIENAIKTSREDPRYFYSDLQLRCNKISFLEFVIGKNHLDTMYDFLGTLGDYKFLISFDGIDRAFDRFRRDSIYQQSDLLDRSIFERDWLAALLRCVVEARRSDTNAQSIGHQMHFCITIPEDRFMEITRSERDSIEYRPLYQRMNWSGIELAILIRKRLELLANVKTEKERRPEERLSAIFRSSFKHIPTVLSINLNGRTYNLSLFCYILRHTLWRPREVLNYYAKLLSACEFMRKKPAEITDEFICSVVNSLTIKLVEDEFIGEFKSTIINIDEIVRAFTSRNQLIEFDEIEQALGGITFKWATGYEDTRDTSLRIKILYRLGFLGVLAQDKTRNELNIHHRHAFIFNEGDEFIRNMDKTSLSQYTYIIHPMFVQYLGVSTSEMILPLTWDYLHENEALQYA